MSMEALSTLTGNLLRSGAFYIVQPILGGVDDEGSHIYSIDAPAARLRRSTPSPAPAPSTPLVSSNRSTTTT